MFYPNDFNGAWVACPDPIDFRAYTVVNIYEDKNAYYVQGPFKRTPRPGQRNYLGHVSTTLEQTNHRELALGTNSRSGDQWDVWESVYSPVGANGYPKPIWNKLTGEIDRDVAMYWRDNYDLSYILQRDWKRLGPLLAGKLRIYVGDMDNYYLNNAVYRSRSFSRRPTRLRTRSWITAIAPSIAGTAITRAATRIRGCAIRRWCCRGRSSGSCRLRPRALT